MTTNGGQPCAKSGKLGPKPQRFPWTTFAEMMSARSIIREPFWVGWVKSARRRLLDRPPKLSRSRQWRR